MYEFCCHMNLTTRKYVDYYIMLFVTGSFFLVRFKKQHIMFFDDSYRVKVVTNSFSSLPITECKKVL